MDHILSKEVEDALAVDVDIADAAPTTADTAAWGLPPRDPYYQQFNEALPQSQSVVSDTSTMGSPQPSRGQEPWDNYTNQSYQHNQANTPQWW